MAIQAPARLKEREMILRAGTPMRSISSEALNIPRSASGNRWKISVPQSMMLTARVIENVSASLMRSLLRAP